MMSSFSRMGTIWSGAHSGLNNDILRGEWGFDGFVISDCAWREYMGVVDGLVGGNNVIILEKVRNSSKANGLNFDYMTLDTDAALGWKSEQGVGHTYGEWSLVSAPSLTVEGVIACYCTTCRDLKEATL
ncbi:MAG: hypothetical protein OSJ83_12370, partial [Clostridia bacterium]|nr:hypothetical protein [Clostridia bacterium]